MFELFSTRTDRDATHTAKYGRVGQVFSLTHASRDALIEALDDLEAEYSVADTDSADEWEPDFSDDEDHFLPEAEIDIDFVLPG